MAANFNEGRSCRQKKMIPSIMNKPEKKPRKKERSDQFRSKFHMHLVEKKQDLEKTIDYLVKGNNDDFSKISFDGMTDELDRTDREMAAQNFYKFLDRKRNELKRIEILLDRINHDQDFGICEDCGTAIPDARLMIIPEAVLCIRCQEDLEKFESRTNFSSSNSKTLQYKDDFEQEEESDDIDDAGFVSKDGAMSFMDMEEIDLTDLPEASEGAEDDSEDSEDLEEETEAEID